MPIIHHTTHPIAFNDFFNPILRRQMSQVISKMPMPRLLLPVIEIIMSNQIIKTKIHTTHPIAFNDFFNPILRRQMSQVINKIVSKIITARCALAIMGATNGVINFWLVKTPKTMKPPIIAPIVHTIHAIIPVDFLNPVFRKQMSQIISKIISKIGPPIMIIKYASIPYSSPGLKANVTAGRRNKPNRFNKITNGSFFISNTLVS